MTMPDLLQLPDDTKGHADASDILRKGGLVAFPTETVYGLGANARDSLAVARIFDAKGRPSFNPLIVHVHDLASAEQYVQFSRLARDLAAAFWPGPLTLVLPIAPASGISSLVTAGLDTLAIRVPAHPTAQALLRAFDGPIAAPSANPSGRISPTSAGHVVAGLGPRIDAVVDGGSCDVGVESTILDCTSGHQPTLLRAGGLPIEAIEAAIGETVSFASPPHITAPGQLASHYAPSGLVRLNATAAKPGETLIGFGDVDAPLNLSRSGDMVEAASNLFEFLHKLDDAGVAKIAVAPIPETGLGRAINDRLRRAAAPR